MEHVLPIRKYEATNLNVERLFKIMGSAIHYVMVYKSRYLYDCLSNVALTQTMKIKILIYANRDCYYNVALEYNNKYD